MWSVCFVLIPGMFYAYMSKYKYSYISNICSIPLPGFRETGLGNEISFQPDPTKKYLLF